MKGTCISKWTTIHGTFDRKIARVSRILSDSQIDNLKTLTFLQKNRTKGGGGGVKISKYALSHFWTTP